jgi:hypothetical protein
MYVPWMGSFPDSHCLFLPTDRQHTSSQHYNQYNNAFCALLHLFRFSSLWRKWNPRTISPSCRTTPRHRTNSNMACSSSLLFLQPPIAKKASRNLSCLGILYARRPACCLVCHDLQNNLLSGSYAWFFLCCTRVSRRASRYTHQAHWDATHMILGSGETRNDGTNTKRNISKCSRRR